MLSQSFYKWVPLDIPMLFKHKGIAAVAATRGDLGQLAPRKKLLKS
jgi:hypothetical protein